MIPALLITALLVAAAYDACRNADLHAAAELDEENR
jgi:hypothetical protein